MKSAMGIVCFSRKNLIMGLSGSNAKAEYHQGVVRPDVQSLLPLRILATV
jgi:hypothetical protein